MQFRVVVPEHAKPGRAIRISCPDGTEADVHIPKGLKTGDSFVFEMSVDQLKNPRQMLDSLQEAPGGIAGDVIAKKGFLDREIANVQDFALAVGVGLMIGASIVVGFLAGILYATRNVEIASETITSTPSMDQMPKFRTN